MIRILRFVAAVSWIVPAVALGGVAGWALAQPSAHTTDQAARRHAELHARYVEARLRLAEARLQLAEQDLAAATALHSQTTDTIRPLAIRILERHLELARLPVEIWNDQAFLTSATAVLQMQIDQLGDQLQDVTQRVESAPTIDRR